MGNVSKSNEMSSSNDDEDEFSKLADATLLRLFKNSPLTTGAELFMWSKFASHTMELAMATVSSRDIQFQSDPKYIIEERGKA